MTIERVFIVYHGFRTRGGGLRRHILQMSQELGTRGIHPEVLSLEELPVAYRYAPHVVQVVANTVAAPTGDYARFGLTRALLAKILGSRLREGRNAVVFEDVYTACPVGVPSLTVAHALQSDNVYGHALTETALRRARAWDRAAVMRLAGPVVTVSEEYRRHIGKALGGDAAKRFGVIPLGINMQEFPDTPPARPNDIFRLVCVGTLEARKNVAFLLEVLSRVLSAGCERIRLTLVGDGPLRPALEAATRHRGLTKVVEFVGSLPPASVPAVLRRQHMLLHSSLRESFGYALLEAKISGLCTIATSEVEVPREFVDHALPLNADTWARTVVSVYESWARGDYSLPSRDSLTQLRSQYSVQRMVDSYLAVLQHSTSRPAPVPSRRIP